MNKDTILVYGRSEPPCPSCTNAKQFLDKTGLKYDYRDISKNHQANTDFNSQRLRTVPAVFVNGEFIGGYEALVKFLQEV